MGLRLGIAGGAMLLYLASCLALALRFDRIERASDGPHLVKGWEAALLGWQGIFLGNLGWIANPILLIGLVFALRGSWRPAAVCAGLALLLALDTLRLVGKRVIADEGGVTHMVLSQLHAGFYLWIASIALVLVGSLWARKQ